MNVPPGIIDTNVVVSGLLTGNSDAATRVLLDTMLAGEVRFYLSVPLVAEYREVLLRPKIRSLHQLSEGEIDTILEEIALHGILRDPDDAPNDAPDPGDQHLWDLAATVSDAVVVTGDLELVDRAPEAFSVLRTEEYVDLMRSSS